MPPGPTEARALRAVHDDPVFHATRSPYVVLDRSLRIHAANPAYLAATLRAPGELVGRHLFDVFPEHPGPPGGDGMARVTASLLRVLRSGERDHLGILRYDVPAPRGATGFVEKTWVAVNSPVRDGDDRTIGILVHAEDVTALWAALPHPGTDAGDPDGDGGAPRRIVPLTGHGPHRDGAGPVDPVGAVALARELAAENARLHRRFGRHAEIEQAKGVLMAEQGCGPEEAFATLRELSQTTNTKLWKVARSVVDRAIGARP